METVLPFPDRAAAGRELGRRLTDAGGAGLGIIMLALPRGGVPVAVEAAGQIIEAAGEPGLGVEVDVLMTRKIGHPRQPELGLGAIAEGGLPVFDTEMMDRLKLTRDDLAGVVARERAELDRRVAVYRGTRPLPA